MIAVYQKEIKSYFNNLFAYLYIALIMLFMGIFATFYHFKNMSGDISYSLNSLALVVLLVTPLLTMRIIAGERQRKTDQLLYSLPLSMSSVVVAKYFAMLTVYTVPMACIGVYPLVMSFFGTVNLARSYAAILAFFLMGACLLAIGMFISALTENQVISAVLSFVAMLIIYFAGSIADLVPATAFASFVSFAIAAIVVGIIVFIMVKNYIVALSVTAVLEIVLSVVYKIKSAFFEGLFADVVGWLSVYERCFNFYNGIFDLTAIVYFLSVIFLFVFLTIQAMEKRRYS